MNRREPALQRGRLSFCSRRTGGFHEPLHHHRYRSDGHSDADATIGYDPPLRTFFLQAFPDETGDDLALWLGTSDREYETIEALHAAAQSRGLDFMPLPADIAAELANDLAEGADRQSHDGPFAELLKHLQSR